MRAVVTVIGKDKVGIIAGVSSVLAEKNTNILSISQTIMDEFFTMIMMVNFEQSSVDFSQLSDVLSNKGKEMGVEIRIQHEDIFNSMHRL